ncbi:MAG TPA: cation-translocating P-type ATPase [Firmicutes bacterium]|nr:cation-translocating P-type ATPase [Bacillota bacterium]
MIVSDETRPPVSITRAGLSQEEAEIRLRKFGPNELAEDRPPNPLSTLVTVFKEPMFLLLIAALSVYLFLGEIHEAATMAVFVCFVVGITFVQEWRTEKTIQALKDLSAPKATVLRGGERRRIPTREVVPGDILVLEEGERIAADGRLLEVADLAVDESVLTGESEPVWKEAASDTGRDGSRNDDTGELWRHDLCYAGTMVVQGQGLAEVVATGAATQYGRIAKALKEVEDRPTPLQIKIRHLVKGTAWLGLLLCLLVVIVTLARGTGWVNSVIAGITLAMAMIPEEFPVVLTVFLALGAWRLGQNRALIRKTPAVETLGSATVLCVDKTGTLTLNQMTVRGAYFRGRDWQSDDPEFPRTARELLELGVLACETEPYDPMEKALHDMARRSGCAPESIYEGRDFVHEYPFTPANKMMGHIWQRRAAARPAGDAEPAALLAVKGAPETVLPLCHLTPDERDEINAAVLRLARQGWRVLAFAKAEGVTVPFAANISDYTLTFVGLMALADPPRPGVREAVATCRQAGVRVVMITGDHAVTAQAIGREIGLARWERVLTGADIERMSDAELAEAVRQTDIFARVIPQHKLRIVRSLRQNGDITAMTGDGVNDAPALKEADIGIAMGRRGTEVARQAADMILLDDNFTTIVHSVEDGRRIYDNIRKAIAYIMIIHIPIAALALLVPALQLPLLLLPVHIVLLELLIDPTCSIVFEAAPPEENVMARPPRPPQEPLVNRGMVAQILLQGATVLLAALLPYMHLLNSGASVELARTVAFTTLVLSNIGLVLVNGSETQFALQGLIRGKNKARLWVNGLTLVALIGIVYVPFLQKMFATAPLNLTQAGWAVGLAMAATFWWELVKAARRWSRRSRRG